MRGLSPLNEPFSASPISLPRGACAGTSRLHSRRPERAAGRSPARITEDTRIRASLPAIRDGARRRRGGDGHLAPRPADRGRARSPRTRSRRSRARLGELLGRARAAAARLGRRRRRCAPGAARACSRTAASTRGEKKNDPALAQKMAALCDVFVQRRLRHRAPRRGVAPTASPQFAQIACAGPLLAAEIDAITEGAAPTRSGRWWRSSPAARSRPSCTILQSAGDATSTG